MIDPLPDWTLAPEKKIRVNWTHLLMWAALIFLFFAFLSAVKPILMPFVLGITVAYLMDPIADKLVRRGMSRPVAAAVITLVLFSLLTYLVVTVGPILYHQLLDLLAKVPALIKQTESSLQHGAAPLLKTLHNLSGGATETASIPSSVGEMAQSSLSSITGVMTNLLASAATLVNILALLLITPIVCFYLIRDWPGVLTRTNHLLPLAYAPTIRQQLRLINKTLAAYLRGQITVVAILIVYYCVAFMILDVNYSLLLGLIAGLLVVIPYIGPVIAIGLGLTIAYSQFGMNNDWWWMVGIYGFGNILEGQYLTPKVIGDRVGLHPLWMLFGMLAGAALFGFVGVILAVPLTAAISVLVKFAVQIYLDSTLYTQA